MLNRYQESSNVILDSSEINDSPKYNISFSEKRNKVNKQFPKSAGTSFSATALKKAQQQSVRSSIGFIKQSLSNQRKPNAFHDASRNVSELRKRSSTENDRNQMKLGSLLNNSAPASKEQNDTNWQDPYQSPGLDASHRHNMSSFATHQS